MVARAGHRARRPPPGSAFKAATSVLPHGSRLETNRTLLHCATVAASSADPWSRSAACTSCQTPRYTGQDIIRCTAMLNGQHASRGDCSASAPQKRRRDSSRCLQSGAALLAQGRALANRYDWCVTLALEFASRQARALFSRVCCRAATARRQPRSPQRRDRHLVRHRAAPSCLQQAAAMPAAAGPRCA